MSTSTKRGGGDFFSAGLALEFPRTATKERAPGGSPLDKVGMVEGLVSGGLLRKPPRFGNTYITGYVLAHGLDHSRGTSRATC